MDQEVPGSSPGGGTTQLLVDRNPFAQAAIKVVNQNLVVGDDGQPVRAEGECGWFRAIGQGERVGQLDCGWRRIEPDDKQDDDG